MQGIEDQVAGLLIGLAAGDRITRAQAVRRTTYSDRRELPPGIYSVKLEYDFAAGVARYWLNSKLVYTSEPTSEPESIDWVLGDVDMIIGSFDRSRPAHVIGFFDNYEIKVSGRNAGK